MKLISLKIENFGNLSNFSLQFSGGINTLYRENGFGKSTLAAFIKAMFYGLADTRKISLFENERKRYQPWQGGVYGGYLAYEADGKCYRVERTFGTKASDDTFALYLTDIGKKISDAPEEIGKTLFGIDADGFERTVFLSERNLSGKNENQSVAEKLSNLVGTTGDVGALDEALDRLEEMRKYYFKKGGSGSIAESEARRNLVLTKLEELEENEKKCEEQRMNYEQKCKEADRLKKERDDLREEERVQEAQSAKANLAKQYRRLSEERDTAKRSRDALHAFFSAKLPTDEEIDAVASEMAEAEYLKKQEQTSERPPDADTSLYRKTSPEVIGRMTVLADELEQANREKRDREVHGAPEARMNFALFAVCGILFIIAGIALGMFISQGFYGLCAVGIFCLIWSFTAKKGFQKQSAAWESALARLTQECGEKERALREFLIPFGEAYADPIAAAREVKVKYEMFRNVLLSEEERERNPENDRDKARRLQNEIRDFLALFPTESDSPLAEIRRKKNLLENAERALRGAEDAVSRFPAENGTTEAELFAAESKQNRDTPSPTRLAEKEEEYLRADREATRLRTQYEAMSASLRDADALMEEKRELEEKIALDRKKLETVKKTKIYLEAAKDHLNAMYLDGTKRHFCEYVRAIGSDDADFTMDTTFDVARFDLGATRSAEAYSMGKRDLYHLAARLALVDSLYENEQPILILDDPFVHLDDEALKRAKTALKVLAKRRQILYLTCTAERKI